MANFDAAVIKHTTKVKELGKILRFYSYVDEASSVRTEGKLKDHLTANFRQSKDILFNIIQFVFEIHADKKLDPIFEPLRTEIDVFGDEIKVSHVKWVDLPENFWELVIAHDLTLVDNSTNLTELCHKMEKLVTNYKGHWDKVFDMDDIRTTSDNMNSVLKGLRQAFKEREAIFSLKDTDMKTDFEEVKEKLKMTN